MTELTISKNDGQTFAYVSEVVTIDWAEAERQALKNNPFARLLLAVRDGTWKPMSGADGELTAEKPK